MSESDESDAAEATGRAVIRAQIAQLQTELTRLQTELDNAERRLESRVEGVEKRLDALAPQTAQLAGQVHILAGAYERAANVVAVQAQADSEARRTGILDTQDARRARRQLIIRVVALVGGILTLVTGLLSHC